MNALLKPLLRDHIQNCNNPWRCFRDLLLCACLSHLLYENESCSYTVTRSKGVCFAFSAVIKSQRTMWGLFCRLQTALPAGMALAFWWLMRHLHAVAPALLSAQKHSCNTRAGTHLPRLRRAPNPLKWPRVGTYSSLHWEYTNITVFEAIFSFLIQNENGVKWDRVTLHSSEYKNTPAFTLCNPSSSVWQQCVNYSQNARSSYTVSNTLIRSYFFPHWPTRAVDQNFTGPWRFSQDRQPKTENIFFPHNVPIHSTMSANMDR